MKNLLLVICFSVILSASAMQNQIVTQFDDQPSEDRKVASMLDAYMGAQMSPHGKKELMFLDYKTPDILCYSYSVKTINNLIFDITGLVKNGLSEEEIAKSEQIFEKFKSNPDQLADSEAKRLQILTLGEFLMGDDLPEEIEHSKRLFTMANRARYQAAWATRKRDVILREAKTLQLHPAEALFTSLPDQISGFKELAKKETI